MERDIYDFVIVGAGAAGCVLAYRLSEDAANSVLLIEAGGADRNPFIHMPKGIIKAMANPSLIWPFMTRAAHYTNNLDEPWARGKTLGGSSAVNGMMYVRGQAADFDAVAATTSDDWNWTNIGQAYKELESHELGAGASRGDRGPLHITLPDIRDELTDATIEAGVSLGLMRRTDVNDPSDDERIGYAPRTVYKGRRQSAAVAFLNPIRGRPNLTVVTGVTVEKVSLDRKRANGVIGAKDGVPVHYRARREVLLCAGALATPAILHRSGIGPAEHLHKIGVQLVHESPRLGFNLREHRAIVMQWRTEDNLSTNRQYTGVRLAKNVVQYYVNRRGPMSAATYEAGAWFKTRPGLHRSDGQFLIAPYSFDYSGATIDVERKGGMQLCGYILRPESTGTVMARSADPRDLPVIVPNYHTHDGDRQKMIDLIRYARTLVATAPLAKYIRGETRPGADFASDDQIIAAYDTMGNGAYHASGTAEMGTDDAAPVDPALRVRGIAGLRVADTSILPFLVAGNTNGPAMAMAWRGADLILSER